MIQEKKNKLKTDKERWEAAKKRATIRIRWLQLIFVAAMVVLVVRVGYIKIVNGQAYEKEVLTQMVSAEYEIQALRGSIVDRNNKTIASSLIVYHIILDPKAILELTDERQQITYDGLANYLGCSANEIKQIVMDNPSSRYKILHKNISLEDKELLQQQKLLGVWYENSFLRKYPRGSFASQVVGFYNQEKGQYGLEQYYQSYMVGKTGRVFPKLQDGNIVTNEISRPRNGDTIVTTIDEVIQQYVEQVMNKYIKMHNPLHASAIIMNPNTGEIYSMFSYPFFDPNAYNNLSEQLGESTWENMSAEERADARNSAWRNFNTQFPYEPGSTFKPLIFSVAIEEGYLDENRLYDCTGGKTVVDTYIKCWKTSGHGLQTWEQVQANSCNVGTIEIASEIPKEVFYQYQLEYGLGSSTGIDLPGEAIGILHSLDGLGPVEKATSSIGQTFTITPIQLLTASAALVNGGYLLEPYIVSQIIDNENNMTYQHKTTIRRQVISSHTSQIMANSQIKVVTEGTGDKAAVTGYSIGGKTGTAEKLPREEKKHIYSFVGYAPAERPEVIALVLFDDIPDDTGAPTRAFKEIMENVLPYLEIATTQVTDVVDQTMKTVPTLISTTLHEGISSLEKLNLDYEVIGVGSRIVNQYPTENTQLPEGASVKIYVETDTPDLIEEIPDLIGLSFEEAKTQADGLFILEGNAGTISHQIPKSGVKIEKNQKILVQTSP